MCKNCNTKTNRNKDRDTEIQRDRETGLVEATNSNRIQNVIDFNRKQHFEG